jgi:hypothetical protein
MRNVYENKSVSTFLYNTTQETIYYSKFIYYVTQETAYYLHTQHPFSFSFCYFTATNQSLFLLCDVIKANSKSTVPVTVRPLENDVSEETEKISETPNNLPIYKGNNTTTSSDCVVTLI